MTLALARGPFIGLQTTKERERATRRRRGAALSRATPRALAARWRRGRRGGGGRPSATGASHGPRATSHHSVLLWAEPVSFSLFVLPEPAAGTRSGEPRSLPLPPQAHGLRTAAPAPKDRGLKRHPGSSCPPAPNPDLAGSISYPKPGACGSAPAPTAPQLQPPGSFPEAARSA